MMPRHKPPRSLPDQIIRESLQHPASLREFLQDVVPHLATGFDCERARLIDREFPMEDWRSREADLPFEIPYRTAEEERLALVCVLIEHQSDTDPLMPLRSLYFGVGYWDRQWKAWAALEPPRPPLRLSPVLPIVLYTGPTPWGSNRTMADLLTEPQAFHVFAPVWEPLFWNLAEHSPQQLLNSGAAWLELMSVMRVERADAVEFQAVFAEAAQRLAALQGREEVRWSDFLRIVLTYASWRRPPAEGDTLTKIAMEANPTRKEEVRQMAQTIAEALIEEGRAEGRAEGELGTQRENLRRLLLRKFQQLPDTILQRIETCADVEKLKAAIDRVLDMKSLNEFDL